MAVGMEVALGSDHIVLDGDPALSPEKGAVLPPRPPNFRPLSIVDGSR